MRLFRSVLPKPFFSNDLTMPDNHNAVNIFSY